MMTVGWGIGGMALLVVGLALPARAQQPAPSSPPSSATRPSTLDVGRLPVDLHRIERQLRQHSEREQHEGLRLRYFVDVYGKAPKIELFAPDEDLAHGPTPWGAPTHRDMLEVMTPKEFRTPIMDFNALMRWLTDKLNQ
jgi:hypothetical protein